MDANMKMVLITIIQSIRDPLLVLTGAIATYYAQKLLFNKQYKERIENKEGEMIEEAIDFLNKSGHEINYFVFVGDSARFKEIFEKEHIPKLGLISFRLKRIKDQKIAEIFVKAYKEFQELGLFVSMHGKAASKEKRFEELNQNFEAKKEEFGTYCAQYSKLKK